MSLGRIDKKAKLKKWKHPEENPSAKLRVRNDVWSTEQLILALELYLEIGNTGKSHKKVIALTSTFERLRRDGHPGFQGAKRTPSAVSLKIANFASLDPLYWGKGMNSTGQRDQAIWDRYARDEDLLNGESLRIKSFVSLQEIATQTKVPDKVERIPLEESHTKSFKVVSTDLIRTASRREAELVKNYVDYLRKLGHEVEGLYFNGSHRCDVYDFTSKTIIEAKGSVSRESVRMAIGQLLDYRFLKSDSSNLAILLPRRPANQILELLAHLSIRTIWPSENGWEAEPTIPK